MQFILGNEKSEELGMEKEYKSGKMVLIMKVIEGMIAFMDLEE